MKFMMPFLSGLRSMGRTKILQSIALIGLILITSAMARYWWQGPNVAIETIERRDFVQTVVASGHVESPHRIEIGTQLTGTVRQVPVLEGQSVLVQQVLIELENSELLALLKQAELNVKQAKTKIRQLKEVQSPMLAQAYQQALANHSTSQNALYRAQELYNKGFTGQASLDEVQRVEKVAASQALSLKEQLTSMQEGGSDYLSAEINLSQAYANVDLAKARLRYAQITAPVSGTLISRNVEPGDVVQPGKVLMTLSPSGSTELVVQIDEKHLSQLKVGQTASVSADAFSSQNFKATVAFINPGVDAQRGSVTVKLHIPNPPVYLQQDMTVSLNIETAKRSQVILISSEAVHELDKAPWVLRLQDGKTQRHPIELGLRSAGWCEVLSGLEPGDKVIRDAFFTKDNVRIHFQ
jgi:HlyD family secretion protein